MLAVETPALVVDVEAMEANIQRMVDVMEAYPEVALRPHAKTHKTIEVADLQLQKPRTVGLCCQKVSEAVAMADVAKDVLLSNEVASPAKARRIAALTRRGCTVTVVLDSQVGAEMLASAARVEGTKLGVLIDVNVGQNRCGVDTPAQAVALAREIAGLEELRFRGIQAYYDSSMAKSRNSWLASTSARLRWSGRQGASERRAASGAATQRAAEVAEALSVAGFDCEVVMGGGTGTFEMDAASGVFTEVQPGSYVFGDYSGNLDDDGAPVANWRQSLFVAATVVSRNEAERRVVLDAGAKAVSSSRGPPSVQGWAQSEVRVENGGDEHTILCVSPEAGRAMPGLGEQVLLIPRHYGPTVNLHDHLVASRSSVVEAVWQVAARGPGF